MVERLDRSYRMRVIAYGLAFCFLLAGVAQTRATDDSNTERQMQIWTAERERSRLAFCKWKWPGTSAAQASCVKKQERASKIVEVYTKTVMEMVESKVAGMKPVGVAVFKMWGLCSTMSKTQIDSFLGPYIDDERMESCFAVQYEIYQDLVKALRY